ncbi:hypothetical protein [Spirochaeta cellobiosiphila]|uniref:hypothetical protein n=1 Tax=Spirochaeta cellobiosiphila TaxID=504483 RepID=UPI0004297B9E|nr:hypothetical protein [Spirochaeta cellobiosiphila]
MEILLNKQPMDIQLEGENVLGDIISELEIWLAKENYVIQTLKQDNENIDLSDNSSWKDTDIKGITKLEVEAVMAEEARYNNLETIAIYLTNLKEAMLQGNKELASDLLTDFEGVTYSFNSMMDSSFVKSAPLNVLISEIHNWETNTSKENLPPSQGLVQALEICVSMVVIQIKEISNPIEECDKAFTVLEGMLPGLRDLSLMLQTGKDKEALNLVITLTEVLNKIMRLFGKYCTLKNKNLEDLSIQELPAQEFFTALNNIFNELGEAFESNDSILIGDLSEYEIVPKLESLIEIRNSI